MYNKPIFFLSIIIIGALLTSCVERYRPNLEGYNKLLVIDGGISNLPGPYTVRLSLSAPLSQANFIPKTGCQLLITDNLGNSELLTETEPGIYQTDSSGMKGIVGRQYKLSIQLAEGSRYESGFETLLQAVELDSVYAKIEFREDETVDHTLGGYQFYLDTKPAESVTNYYLWNLEATYQYQSDYTIRWIYRDTLEWFHAPFKLYNCWKDDPIDNIFVFNTQALNTPVLREFPLHYVNTETRKLSVRYSLLVKQYTINEQAFTFFEGLSKNNQPGSLYAQQPSQIQGNVHNIDHPEEQVLGYFLVAGMHKKRLFVDRPLSPVYFYYSVCSLTDADFEAYAQLQWYASKEFPYYAIETPGGRRAVPNQSCVDCQLKGGTITKPDFWVD